MVDFIELANGSRWLIDRALSSNNNNDDDFTRLENIGGGGIQQPDDSILNSMSYPTSETSGITTGSGNGGDWRTQPFLSKSAEAELYMLATNFLLYVAMVIISIMVAKIYFPESLERSEIPIPPSTRSRNYSYHRRSKIPKSDDEYDPEEEDEPYYGGYNDDDSPEDDLYDENNELEALYSDDDDGAEFDDVQEGNIIHNNNKGDDDGDDESSDIVEDLLSETQPASYPQGQRRRRNVNILEFDQTQTSRTKVLQRLLGCSLMLNITFVTWGALQERMLTRRYPRHTGDYFTYSYALVFTNRFWTLVMSGILLLYLKPRLSRTTVLYEYSFPSISNMLSSWCQYEALRYVSFPAAALFKSFKLAPVMLMGKILGNKTCKFFSIYTRNIEDSMICSIRTKSDDCDLGILTFSRSLS